MASSWTRKLAGALSALALAVLGGVSGGAFTYYVAGRQEVNAQAAVDEYKRNQDSNVPPVRIENTGPAFGWDGISLVRSEALDLTTASFRDVDELSQILDGVAADEPIFSPGDLVVRSQVSIRFTLVGQHNNPVQLTRILARVDYSSSPPSGTIVFAPPEGGDDIPLIGFSLNKEGPRDALVVEDRNLQLNRRYLDENQITLARDERMSFEALVQGTRDYDFHLELQFSDGSTVLADAGENGRSWHLNAYAESYNKAYKAEFGSVAGQRGRFIECAWPKTCLGG
jgi:hypothetical protein